MKCLVTGATGFLGTNLVHVLVRQGWEVTALGLPSSETRYLRELPVKIVQGDVLCPEDLDAAAGSEVVFHVAGDTSFWSRNFARQRRINVEGAENVARACLRHGVRRLVHTSTIDALGYNPKGLADEDWPDYNYAGTGYNYADTKREGQMRVMDLGGKDLEVVVTYPGSMLGPFDFTLQFGRLFFDLRDGKVPACPAGGIAFGHVAEVARAHVDAALKGRPGAGYILAGVNATYRELFTLIARKFGKNAPRWDMPPRLFTLYGYLQEAVSHLTRKPPDMNPGMARFMSVKAFYDSSRAVRELGYRVVPLRSAVDDAYDWYKENGFL